MIRRMHKADALFSKR